MQQSNFATERKLGTFQFFCDSFRKGGDNLTPNVEALVSVHMSVQKHRRESIQG